MKITEDIARKVVKVVSAGLVAGVGEPTPGKMCVEAAVCYALGEPHGDRPSCVHSVVRVFKVALNDGSWSSATARARGMKRVAVAQLGSTEIDPVCFVQYVAEQTIKRILPIVLREAGLNEVATRCENEGTSAAAWAAAGVAARAVARAARDAAYAAGDAAQDAARAAAGAAAWAAQDAAGNAAYAAGVAARVKRDKILSLAAEIAVEALIICKSEGAQFLSLAGEYQP